jgi:hypothetical protein
MKEKMKIKTNNSVYQFTTKLVYTIIKEEGTYVAKNDFFDIIGYGNSINEAEEDLFSSIDNIWNIYAIEKDENLDTNAKEYKRKILKYIEKL